jgi:hypothetical protein
MNKIKCVVLLLVCIIILVSCSNPDNTATGVLNGCPDAEIEWVDVLKVNDIKYEHHFPEAVDDGSHVTIEKGNEIGKVTFKMADRACSNHVMQNGDAAYLTIGTVIYELIGYPSSFAVVADGNVYIVESNPHAITAGELYPLNGLVKNIYIESTEDGSRLHAFSESSKKQFFDAWYSLKLKDVNTLIKEGKLEGNRVFLEFELNNGVTFRELYWSSSNTFHSGVVGNDEIKKVINKELQKVNKH